MTLSTKLLIILGSILTIGALGFICYKQVEMSNRQIAIESQVVAQKQLIDNIVRSQNQYATRGDVEKFIKDSGVNLKAIKEDLNKLNAEVVAANAVTVRSTGYVASNVASTSTGTKNPTPTVPTATCDGKEVECTGFDPHGYYVAQQNMTLTEPFANGVQVPIGSVGFSAWQEKPWNVEVKPREYHVTNVVGTDENQRTYIYNKFSVKVDGKDYDVKIDNAETKQVYPESKFTFWNPRLYLGASAGVNVKELSAEAAPTLQLGIMSYGRYKKQPDIVVLEVGAGYEVDAGEPAVVVTPFTYNIGKHIPLMNNTYIGPSVAIDPKANFAVMAGISVGL